MIKINDTMNMLNVKMKDGDFATLVKLMNATKRVQDAAIRMEKSKLQIAADMGSIYDKKLWEVAYESFAAFAETVLNIPAKEAVNYVKVSRWLKRTKSFGIIGTSVLAGVNPEAEVDFTFEQLLIIDNALGMRKNGIAIAMELTARNKISPDMEPSEIKKVIKENFHGK